MMSTPLFDQLVDGGPPGDVVLERGENQRRSRGDVVDDFGAGGSVSPFHLRQPLQHEVRGERIRRELCPEELVGAAEAGIEDADDDSRAVGSLATTVVRSVNGIDPLGGQLLVRPVRGAHPEDAPVVRHVA